MPIFDYIIELYRCVGGNWQKLADRTGASLNAIYGFLEYAAMFLGNVGNYYGNGDQKFIPRTSKEVLKQISMISGTASRLHEEIAAPLLAQQPSSLGFPSNIAHSSYYLGEPHLTRDEIAHVSQKLEAYSIHPENTRMRKTKFGDKTSFEVLQASVEVDSRPRELNAEAGISLVRGDHSRELELICACLAEARKYAANSLQEQYISKYQESFRSGAIEPYKEAQRIWVKDLKPPVETIFGFIEPYRDPFGIRAEFEGLVAIVNAEETRTLTTLAEESATFIRRLPWAENATENEGKGPFEKSLFEAPDFTSLQALAYCSSIIFPGINLPNYNDIRQDVGFKNVMISNSIAAEKTSKRNPTAACIHPSEAERFLKHKDPAFYLWVVFHELLGHGTGKLLMQDGPKSFNFDIQKPPINPLTGRPIDCWYRPGQTWTGLFGDIATSVDECRAECVGAYLMSDKELLALFGFTDESEITAADLEYNMYMQLGVAGLRALENYNVGDNKWGQAHSRAHFAMFRCLLAAGDNFLRVEQDQTLNKLTVFIDGNKITTHGQKALRDLLLRLHIYRCTADVEACRDFYEDLTQPHERFLQWREIMLANQEPKQIFVQANTFLKDGQVVLKEYDATIEGMVQSWAERDV